MAKNNAGIPAPRVGAAGVAAVLAVTVVVGFMLTGCASTSMVYHKSVPMKKQCVILNAEEITSIDDTPVSFSRTGLKDGERVSVVYPAGKHTIRITTRARHVIDVKFEGYRAIYDEYVTMPYMLDAYTPAAFEFKPNKRYRIKNISPPLQYHDGKLTSSDENVTIRTSPDGTITVENPSLVIVEAGTMPFSTHIGVEFHNSSGTGWFYNDLAGFDLGPRFGLTILHGNLDIKLLGGVGIVGPFAFPDLSGFKLEASVYYGGLAEIFVNNAGLEFGGGMFIAWNTPYTLYLQAGLLSRDKKNSTRSLYGQYYLNGEKWHNTFGIGCKTHL
ncbi:MAG: hypothetical protein LBG27_06130 [Spirochaetaceae bacterium]|nr:hypothetical protein [Spirochaetaceae bacterium]